MQIAGTRCFESISVTLAGYVNVFQSQRLTNHHFKVYGGKYIKYNNHWAMHIAPQIPDFGPVYGFWEYPGERVNKTLKNIPTNNHRGGEMEKTMLREFLRKMFVDLMVRDSSARAFAVLNNHAVAASRSSRGGST